MILTYSNLHPRPDQPGRGLYNAQLFAALARAPGVRVANVCPVSTWRPWERGRIRGWTVPGSPPYPTAYVPVNHVPVLGRNRAWRAHAAALRAARPDGSVEAILAPWLYPDGVAAARVAREWGIPAWLMALGSDTFHLDHPARRRVILDACAGSAGVICVCESLAARMREAGVPAERVYVAENGVDGERFRYRPRDEAGRLLGAAAGAMGGAETVVLCVGNQVPVKGVDVLVDAWEQIRSWQPGARLCLVGDGPLRGRLERTCRARGYGSSVVFAGVRPHDEIPLWMNAADCLCLPSRSEGMPNVVLEALASGLPVVSSAVGAAPDMLAGEAGGRLVPPGDPAKLAGAVRDLLGAGVDRRAMADRNRGRFSWDRQAASILEWVRGAAERGG